MLLIEISSLGLGLVIGLTILIVSLGINIILTYYIRYCEKREKWIVDLYEGRIESLHYQIKALKKKD